MTKSANAMGALKSSDDAGEHTGARVCFPTVEVADLNAPVRMSGLDDVVKADRRIWADLRDREPQLLEKQFFELRFGDIFHG